jgi:hypothetical protein
MGDNLGPNGLSRVARSFAPRVDLRDSPVPRCVPRGAAHGVGHYGSERAFAVKPARQRRCPCGLRGLTAQRAQASGYHAKNTEKRSLGPGIDLTEPRGELGFIQPRSSFSYQLPQLPQDVKSLFVWSASNKQSLCLMHKYEQHTASLLWHDGPRFAAPLHATPLGGDYSSFQSGVPQTWVITLGPKGLSSGCKVFCSRST